LPEGPERDAATHRLRAGVDRATRLVEQLLALAREERAGARPHATVDLLEIVREVIAESLPLADERAIDLGLESATPVVVSGEREALHVLVRNLAAAST
jgi:two-component system OmpR family sensor kinase